MSEILLEFKNVTYEVRDNYRLVDVSFTLERGEHVVFFGVENAGVDLLFSMILNLDVDFDGEILYKGTSIEELDYASLLGMRFEIGYVHGNFGLLSNMTVEQNITLPLDYHYDMSRKEIQELVTRLLDELHLSRCRNLRPFDLTGSEILRTAYARAIAHDPGLLIIEHAFLQLPMLNIITILDHLKERARNKEKSLILASYYPRKFLDIADRFIMMYRGKIVFQGSKDDFLGSDNPYLVQFNTCSLEGPMKIL